MHRAHGSFRDHAATPVTVPPRNVIPRTAAYSNPPTQDDWIRIKGIIYQYYVLQNQPLHSVRESLRRDHGFKASERMIKARLAKWEYIKNAKREDWGYLAVLHEIRRKENKPTVFLIRGHRKTVKDLQRFIRNQNVSPDKFLQESFDNFRSKGERVPEYIRACTPGPEDIIYSPSADTPLSELRSPSPLVNEHFEPFVKTSDTVTATSPNENLPELDSSRLAYGHFEHECPYKNYATETNRFATTRKKLPSVPTTSAMDLQAFKNMQLYSCEQTRLELEACSHQLLKPTPLMAKFGNNDMRCWMMINHNSPANDNSVIEFTAETVCSRCDQADDKHFPSLDLFEPRQGQRNILNGAAAQTLHLPASTRVEGSWVWISYCFLACMSLERGDEEYAHKALTLAAEKFEKLLKAKDPLLLTAAGLMITVLHMHNQETIVVRILQCAKHVVDKILPAADPIRITISYLALSADSSGKLLREANFSSSQLERVYHQLKSTYPTKHPYVIAARHNYSWMLKYDNKKAEAEMEARKTYQDSIAYFGTLHMQSITSLSVIAGCLAGERGRESECIEAYRTMVTDATQILGVIHPYTLEAQRRLANCLQTIPGKMDVALKLHRTILFGRATMLGRNHKFTIGQRKDYVELLRKNNRWADRDGRPSKERRELEDLFRKDPEEAWELVSRQDADHEMTDAPSASRTVDLYVTNTSSRGPEDNSREEEWSALGWQTATDRMARSRSASPTSTNEHEAY